jgi:hypothetical protein
LICGEILVRELICGNEIEMEIEGDVMSNKTHKTDRWRE